MSRICWLFKTFPFIVEGNLSLRTSVSILIFKFFVFIILKDLLFPQIFIFTLSFIFFFLPSLMRFLTYYFIVAVVMPQTWPKRELCHRWAKVQPLFLPFLLSEPLIPFKDSFVKSLALVTHELTLLNILSALQISYLVFWKRYCFLKLHTI